MLFISLCNTIQFHCFGNLILSLYVREVFGSVGCIMFCVPLKDWKNQPIVRRSRCHRYMAERLPKRHTTPNNQQNNRRMGHLSKMFVCLFLCLFVCFLGFFVPIEKFFSHMETTPLPVKGCKLRPVCHSWPLGSEGSLTCNTYCDMEDPFIMVITKACDTTLLLSVQEWSCHFLFFTLVCRGLDSKPQPSAFKANTLAHCATEVMVCISGSYQTFFIQLFNI